MPKRYGHDADPIAANLQLNIDVLTEELNGLLSKPSPDLLITKWWQEKHFGYDQRRIDRIINYVEQLNQLNSSVTNLNHQLRVTPLVLQSLISGTEQEIKRKTELQMAEHKDTLAAIEDRDKDRKADVEAKEVANLKVKAEIEMMAAQTTEKKLRADLFALAVANFNSLPDILKFRLTALLLNSDAEEDEKILFAEEFKDFMRMEKEAAARKSQAEARDKEEELEFKKWKHSETKKKKGTT